MAESATLEICDLSNNGLHLVNLDDCVLWVSNNNTVNMSPHILTIYLALLAMDYFSAVVDH